MPKHNRIRFTSVRGHRIRLQIAVCGTAVLLGAWWPYFVTKG